MQPTAKFQYVRLLSITDKHKNKKQQELIHEYSFGQISESKSS